MIAKKTSKYGPREKTKEIPLVDRDGARMAIKVAFRAAAKEAKRVAAELFLEREDVAARSLRDLASLFMVCGEWPADAVEYGCEHIRKTCKLFDAK